MQKQTTPHLGHKDPHTLEQIFQHPASHNLEWQHIVALMEHLGTVEEAENGHLTFTVNGKSVSFHRGQSKDVSEVQQVLDLRHFLESARVGKNGMSAAVPKTRFVAVVNQAKTMVFHSTEKDTVPEHLHPHDPHGEMHRLNRDKGGAIGSQSMENLAYYGAIAETLTDAEELLLIGNGSGGSRAMTHFEEFLKTHHPEIARHIVGTLTLDLEAMSDGQLLAEARNFFETLP